MNTFHFHALEKEMATHSSIAWRIPRKGEPGGLPSMGSHRVGHDWSDLAAAAAAAAWRPTRPFRTNTSKRWPFHYRDWNAKVGSQEIPGVTGKFGFGVQNEAGKRLIMLCQENALVIAKTLFCNTRVDSTHGHHQMGNTKTRLIIFLAAKDGEALYSQ